MPILIQITWPWAYFKATMLYYNIYYFQIIFYFFGFVTSQSLQNSQTLGRFFDPLYILLYMSHILLMCTTELPCHSYRTFPLSQYLAALDLLTRHGLSAYLGHTSHAHAVSLTHTYLHCFWHTWVISTAITPIIFAAYSVWSCTSVSPFPVSWRVLLALYDSYFTPLLVTRFYLYSICSVCTDSSRFRLGLLCNPRTINHPLELRS